MSIDRIAIIIATRGRPALVRETVDWLARQSRRADRIFVVGTRAEDIAALDPERADVTAIVGREGSALQRNDGLRLAGGDFDAVAFFDDDFIPSRYWLETFAALLDAHPGIGGLTGALLADGIKSPGIPLDTALAAVTERDAAGPATELGAGTLHEGFGPYGCNMAFRFSAIRGLAFDERLPLYAWLEDSDFGGQIVRRGGRTARADALWGVHLGNKAGRERGIRVGYSQVANPLYLAGKGTLPRRFLAGQVLRNVASNLAKSIASEPFIDRPGRLKGNVLALSDALLGRARPERVTQL